jgi:hypothetical protein
LALFLLAPLASAQERKTITVPFTRSKTGWLLVKATVNGHAGTFIFDTGATDSLVSPRMADETPADAKIGITRLSGKMMVRKVSAVVSFADKNSGLLVMVAPTDDLSAASECQIDGVIGLSVLGQHKRITIDFQTHFIALED